MGAEKARRSSHAPDANLVKDGEDPGDLGTQALSAPPEPAAQCR
jgi:hypothetical protein